MYKVYIIQSETTGKYYIGYTKNLDERLRRHNSGGNRSTQTEKPWLLVRQESYLTKKEAWLGEKRIKSYKGGGAFKKLLPQNKRRRG